MELSQLLKCEKVAIELAMEAGRMMLNASGKVKEIDQKETYTDLVTESDKAIEVFIIGQLNKHFPDHKIIGEETCSKVGLTDAPTWLLDPIDGTMNFVHQFPFVCVSMGLSLNKDPILGVIYNPFLDKLYTAKKGFGAFCNGSPIHVKTNCERLRDALVVTEISSQRDEERRNAVYKNLEAVTWNTHGLRCLGSSALNMCSIANGFVEAYYKFGIHCWDIAAATVLVREAGGVVMDTEGGPLDLMSRRVLCACNSKIAEELSKALVVHLRLERD